MDLTTTLGLVAGSLTTIAYFPQVLKTWRSRSADGMSWSMLIILCVGIALWLVYGIYVHDTPVILANVFTLLFSSAILAMKIRYEMVPKLQVGSGILSARASDSESLPLSGTATEGWLIESEITFIQPEPDETSPVA